MKLQSKKTGEIWTLTNRNEGTSAVLWVSNGSQTLRIESIEELTSRFEDYEEPKAYYIGRCGTIEEFDPTKDVGLTEMLNEIGNYFETREKAEKAIEKLKAWKRLKYAGFKFEGIKEDYTRVSQTPFRSGKRYLQFNKSEDDEWMKENWEDLKLLFGGKNGN